MVFPTLAGFLFGAYFHFWATGKPLVANENPGIGGFFEFLHFQSQL